jgi:hypothetical protein
MLSDSFSLLRLFLGFIFLFFLSFCHILCFCMVFYTNWCVRWLLYTTCVECMFMASFELSFCCSDMLFVGNVLNGLCGVDAVGVGSVVGFLPLKTVEVLHV